MAGCTSCSRAFPSWPVVRTEQGQTIDGRAREKIAAELGLRNYPVRTVSGLTEEQRWAMHASLNLQRRHLDRKRKREYIADCLRHAPELSDNWLGELCGADHKTVAAVRSELVARWEIPNVKVFRGKDGKRYRFTTVPTETAPHARQAAEALRRLGPPPGTRTAPPRPRAARPEAFPPRVLRLPRLGRAGRGLDLYGPGVERPQNLGGTRQVGQ
jgi:hypothetical protein